MTTRFNAKDKVNYGVSGVKSGYDGLKSDLYIPSCGIEDVDQAIFNLFEKEIQITVGGKDSAESKKVPVIFAAGEKWALLKRGKALRDKNNSLIVPLVTITRTSVNQDSSTDVVGRGINQQTGELVIKRRLDSTDRDYQNLINRNLVVKQKNVALNPDSAMLSQVSTDRQVGELSTTPEVVSGGFLKANRRNNIFETIVVPSPQFYTATYEITVWMQFIQHLNQATEKLMSSFLPQAQSWKLTTEKGYWFIASLDGGFETENNFDDLSSSERFIKLKFNVKVPAYVWASAAPGVPIPVKKYVSSPIIRFEVGTTNPFPTTNEQEQFSNNLLLGSDDPTLPLEEKANSRDDQRSPGWNVGKVQPSNSETQIDANDPALKTLPRGVGPYAYNKIKQPDGSYKYVKVVNINSVSGETTYMAGSIDDLKLNPV